MLRAKADLHCSHEVDIGNSIFSHANIHNMFQQLLMNVGLR